MKPCNLMLIRQFFYAWLLLLSIFFLSSCQSIATRTTSIATKDFPHYWLTTSMYYGQFYDDDNTVLMDPRPFLAIDYVHTIDDFTLYPPKAKGVVLAGTMAKIVSIDFPDEKAMAKRPIYSPKDHVWIYFKIAKDRGNVSIFHEKDYIWVLPKNIKTTQQIKGYISRFLSKENPNQWILPLPSHIQKGIFEKQPVMGMKKKYLLATLGPALKKQFRKKTASQKSQELWHYDNYFIIIEDDVVTKIKRF